jgi:hypothetical protein
VADVDGFDEWFDRVWTSEIDDHDEAVAASDDSVDAEWRAWFRRLFEVVGAIDPTQAWASFEAARLLDVEWAVGVVLEDVRRTSQRRPSVSIDTDEGWVRIVVDGSWAGPSILALPGDCAKVLVEAAGYLQDEVMDQGFPVWPTCPTHDRGLHPTLHDGHAVWHCSDTNHVVAEIGQLGT